MEVVAVVRIRRLSHAEPAVSGELLGAIRSRSRPLRTPVDLDPLLERVGDARFVLLGEASHGTAEYYTWRAQLSQRLIREKEFSFVAVEGDWPDCYRVNRYVRGFPDSDENAREVLHAFEYWPTWMWANEEVVAFVGWLRRHNDTQPEGQKVGFYGLDVYSLWDSLYQVMGYLRRYDPAALSAARRAFGCFEPYGEDIQEYARATRWVGASCEDEVVALLSELRHAARHYPDDGRETHFNAEQNALVVRTRSTTTARWSTAGRNRGTSATGTWRKPWTV
jgi:erythromycin esterase